MKNYMLFGTSILEGFWEGLGRVLGSQNIGLEAKNLPSEVGNHPKIHAKLKLLRKVKKIGIWSQAFPCQEADPLGTNRTTST